ncbi:MAG: OmpH family outer membrane protein [Myxococcales bacterium]|nr:OmpH family outer membrane protein [Myxococcales bacterium]
MRRITVAVICLAVVLAAAPAFAGKVGFVDLQKVLDLTKMGKEISKQIAARTDELKIEVKKKELEVITLRDQLQKSEAALSEAAKKAKYEELQTKMGEYYQLQQKAGYDLESAKLELFKKVIAQVKDISSKLAVANGYDLVLLKVEDVMTEGSVVLYGASSVDLTDQIIRQMNQ